MPLHSSIEHVSWFAVFLCVLIAALSVIVMIVAIYYSSHALTQTPITPMSRTKIVLLHWDGRLGNRLFQYAFICSYAHRYGLTAYLPSKWEGDTIFVPWSSCSIITDDTLRQSIQRSEATASMRESALQRYIQDTGDTITLVNFGDCNVIGQTNIAFHDLDCMYHAHCFKVYHTVIIDRLFTFNIDVLQSEMYKFHYQRRGTYTAVHVRRGDIARQDFQGAHSMISMQSYEQCLAQYELSDIIWVSDDISLRTYNPWHRQSLGHRWSYPTGEYPCPYIFFDFLPDFLTLRFGRTIVRANSSFSWWAAYLGSASDQRADVLSPLLNTKPPEYANVFYEMNTTFVQGNCPHFMAKEYNDIRW